MSCPECGLDYEAMPVGDTIGAIRGFARRYKAPLTRLLRGEDEAVLRARPAPDTWSALEYATHVAEVFATHARWVGQVLAENRPMLEEPSDDESVVAGGDDAGAPARVAEEVGARAEALATLLEEVPDVGWERVGLLHGEPRSVALVARTAVHEGSHHLLDIGRCLRAVRTRSDPSAPGAPPSA